jgi:hypothetical protein
MRRFGWLCTLAAALLLSGASLRAGQAAPGGDPSAPAADPTRPVAETLLLFSPGQKHQATAKAASGWRLEAPGAGRGWRVRLDDGTWVQLDLQALEVRVGGGR